ncbi:glycosyltransferase family 4 protein [Cardiobacteriaceae bacterium TAE3-ERU3]|nr:glycosyltransferase family 4 protein [Cardiobacteriaceae bacterium TAE3-ERU3]
MKRIAIIGNDAGTMLNFRGDLIVDLLGKQFSVFCVVNKATSEQEKKLQSMGAEVYHYKLNSKGLNPFKDLSSIIWLWNFFREKEIDIAFPYFVKPVIFTSIAAKISGTSRCIGMIEGLGNAFVSNMKSNIGTRIKSHIIKKIQVILYNLSLPFLDVLVLLNRDDKKDLIDHYGIRVKKVVVLGGIGVDLTRFKYSPYDESRPVTFLFIARLLREKGVMEFLRAASLVKSKYPFVQFNVLGSFEEHNTFALSKTELEEYIDNDIVRYLGFVDDVVTEIADSSVFVLPSFYREGVPRSIQEAMAIGRPIITTDVPGCRDTVNEGENGFLIPPHDVVALEEAMIKFIETPELINNMGRVSRKLAEQLYDVQKVNARLINILLNGEVS